MQKTAIITGGGSGIGQALALELAEKNFQIYIIGRREAALKETAAKFPANIHYICADIAETNDRNLIINQLKSLKKIDYLIHNAAVLEPICSLKEIPLEKFNAIMQINCIAPIFLTQQLLSLLINARVLQISSIWAHHAARNVGGYCISKAALYMSKEMWNLELKHENILFGSVMPGMIDTAMEEILRDPTRADYPEHKYFAHVYKEGRLVSPKLCAKFLSYILLQSPAEEFTQGDWDIYETKHHQYWLGKAELPQPL